MDSKLHEYGEKGSRKYSNIWIRLRSFFGSSFAYFTPLVLEVLFKKNSVSYSMLSFSAAKFLKLSTSSDCLWLRHFIRSSLIVSVLLSQRVTKTYHWKKYVTELLSINCLFLGTEEKTFSKILPLFIRLLFRFLWHYMTWSLQTKQAHLLWSGTAVSLQEETMEFLPHVSSLPLALTVNGDRLKHNSRSHWV